MRITPSEVAAILSSVEEVLPGAETFLFGSRAVANSKGGDVDLLVLFADDGGRDAENKGGFSQRLDLLTSLKLKLGDQKIDLILSSRRNAQDDAFIQSILPKAVKLSRP